MSEIAKCTICGEPMPAGEEMFKYHGYSGSCPKPPIKHDVANKEDENIYKTISDGFEADYKKELALLEARCKELESALNNLDDLALVMDKTYAIHTSTLKAKVNELLSTPKTTANLDALVEQIASEKLEDYINFCDQLIKNHTSEAIFVGDQAAINTAISIREFIKSNPKYRLDALAEQRASEMFEVVAWMNCNLGYDDLVTNADKNNMFHSNYSFYQKHCTIPLYAKKASE